VDPLETYPGFSRLLVNDGEQRCEVDLAYDARIQVAESMEYGDVLSLDELAADKVLALFARAEARDFIDVAALLPRYGWPRLCGLAAEKDTGFPGIHRKRGAVTGSLTQKVPSGLGQCGCSKTAGPGSGGHLPGDSITQTRAHVRELR